MTATPDPTTTTTTPSTTGSTGSTAVGGHTGLAAGATRDDRSLGEIVGDIATDLTTLVRQEVELAKTEAREAAVKAGKGGGLLGGAGVAGHLALIFGSLALMFLLDSWMHTGWAALVVTGLWAVVAAVLAARGRRELQQMDPTLPRTQQTLKEDAQWAKHPTA